MISPFRWHGVVETRNFFETIPVNSMAPDIDMELGILFYKPQETPQLEAAKASHLGRVYLDWAAFPFTRQSMLEGGAGYLVDFQDLRYTYPGSRRAPLGAFVLLNPDNQVVDEGMNSSRPPSLEALEQTPGQR
jgi:inner membrane protein